ncbi:MAG: hypothetical protein U5L07_07865 [Desulfobacterales bacterium]|nr:hypothetical protein [Desulfobacterales bacterium]
MGAEICITAISLSFVVALLDCAINVYVNQTGGSANDTPGTKETDV